MLLLSALTVLGIMAAYAANGLIPFSYPISLLGDRADRLSYHAVLALLLIAWAWYLIHCWRARIAIEMILTAIVGLLLVALQFQANEDSGHDRIAAAAMIAVGLLTIRIGCRLDSAAAMAAASASFAACSVVVSGNLVIVGMAENLVLVVALSLLTWDCRRTPLEQLPTVRRWKKPHAALRGPSHWPAGVAAGLAWALACFLIIATGIGCDGLIAGPLVIAISGCSGFFAYREEQPTWRRAGLLSGGMVAVLVLVSCLFRGALDAATMVLVVFLFLWILLLVLIYDRFAPSA